MPNLLVKPYGKEGRVTHVTPEGAGWTYVGFDLFRLKPGGTALFSVPLDQERAETWEPPVDMPAAEIERICGWDHVRLYGRDFPDKLAAAGFTVSEITFTAEEGERHRLTEKHSLAPQGLDRIFVCTK